MDQNKIIVANRTDGLGERLAAILNGMYLCSITNSNFKFNWHYGDFSDPNIDKHIICPFVPAKEDFFNNEFIDAFYLDYLNFSNQEILWWYKGHSIKNVIADLFSSNAIIQCTVATYMNVYYDDIDENKYRKEIQNIFFNVIKFSNAINHAINHAIRLDDYDVIHVRGGDILYRNTYEAMYAAIPVHLAIEIIKTNPKKIIIMGNDIEANQTLKILLKEQRNDIFTSDDFQIDSFSATEKAMFDIVLMSKAKNLYLSGGSAFSVTAYIIGDCKPIFVYEKFTIQQVYNIIEDNMRKYQFNKYHTAFSCLFLYVFGKKNNISLSELSGILKKAIDIRDDVFMYKVFYVDILLQKKAYDTAVKYIDTLQTNLFLNELFYESYGIQGDFCYFFVFNSYLNIENIKEYPILCVMAYIICYKLIKANNCSIIDNIRGFLHRNGVDFDLIENCVFLEQKEDLLNTLSLYFTRNFKAEMPIDRLSSQERIRNHLSYKLGQAMILNSKSILGYMRMPFVLSYIKDKHKQEQKIYQEKIKKNSSLKLPPLECYSDYQKALEEKKCLTYKLGQALIKAHKNWYKGGYIWLWFEIVKLIKDYKKRR